MKKRVLSALLCLVMVVGLLPTAVHADSEVNECWYCGAIYYGDVDDDIYDSDCMGCGIDANPDCWLEVHCNECGNCYQLVDFWCEDCTWCIECLENRPESHCADCQKCFLSEEDELCPDCHRCDACVYICPYCGYCEDCWKDADDTMHCSICGECYEVTGFPEHDAAQHCPYCCEYCEQCGDWETCTADNAEIEYCDECGLCVECCMENRNASGGCLEYCVESSEYEYHFCEDCGECFCDREQCPYCGLCTDCCAANSDCTDSEPMCVEDSNYDDHFCENCGSCKCEGWDEVCEFCGLCPECCEDEIASERKPDCTECDGFKCKEDPDFIQHMADAHEETITHTHRFSVLWSMDEQYHWHDCVACANGKNAEGSMTVAHSFDSQGICKTCGYKSGETVYFTTQPRDVHTAVGDSDDYDRVTEEHGKTHPYEIRTSFRAKAYGKGLSYQWYRVMADKDGNGTKLVDVADGDYNYVSGADTPTLTVCVDNEACCEEIYFYCVATDENGNTARSRSARMIASHRYTYARYADDLDYTSCKYIYVKRTTPGSTGYYQHELPASPGHRWYCCGEHSGDRPSRGGVKPHHFSETPYNAVQAAYTAKAAAAGEYTTFYQYRCTDCGFAKFVEKHEHRMVVAAPEEVGGEELFTKTSHPLICEVAGCDELGSALHNWSFRTVQWPSNGINGGVVRECLDCGYWDEDFTQKVINTATGESSIRYWDRSNMLVEAKNGSVNRTMIDPGESVILTPAKDGVHKFTGWTAKYEYQQEGDAIRRTVNVTLSFTKKADGTWTCTIPTDFFAANGVLGGGKLTFTGTYGSDCTHTNGTTLVGKRDAVCLTDGYTGDKVCNDCGKIVEKGEEFASGSGGKHTGVLTLDESTVVTASCKKHGYEGDYKCSACGGIVRGKSTPFEHGNKVTTGSVAPTCTTDGYTGDTVCNDCDKEFGTGKVIPALGHDWDDGVTNTGRITSITYTCKREGCDATYTRVVRGSGGAVLGAIKELKFTMSSNYTAGNQLSAVRVTESDVRYNIRGNQVYFFTALNMPEDNKTFDLAKAAKGEIGTGKLYLVIPVQAEGEHSFAAKVTAWLNNKIPGEFVADAAIKVPSSDLNGTTLPAATVNTPVVVFDIGAPKAAPSVAKTYTLTVSDSVAENSGAGKYEKGAFVNINAGSKEGYTFDHWAVPDDLAIGNPTDSETTLHMPDRSITITAIWRLNHSHNYGAWRTSASQHWHECSDGSCPDRAGSVKDLAVHKYDNDADTTCNDCGYVRTVGHSHTYAWNKNADQHWMVCIDGDCPDQAGSVKDTAAHVYDNDADTTCNTCGYVRTVKPAAPVTPVRPTTPEKPAKPENPFVDVPENKYFHDAVLWAAENDITGGTTATTFSPYASCTRGQLVTFLWRAVGEPAARSGISFTDVAPGRYCEKSVAWAAENGIVGGYNDGTFRPDATVTRQQTAAILWRFAKYAKMDVSVGEDTNILSYTDALSITEYAFPAIQWAVGAGIMGGSGDKLMPHDTCTRAQIVTFLYRLLSK